MMIFHIFTHKSDYYISFDDEWCIEVQKHASVTEPTVVDELRSIWNPLNRMPPSIKHITEAPHWTLSTNLQEPHALVIPKDTQEYGCSVTSLIKGLETIMRTPLQELRLTTSLMIFQSVIIRILRQQYPHEITTILTLLGEDEHTFTHYTFVEPRIWDATNNPYRLLQEMLVDQTTPLEL